jgi:hypothetical protein
MLKIINELFALPIGLKPVATVGNIPLYGSQTLNDKLIQSIKISKRGKIFQKSIINMINSGVIIPCFADAGILSQFRRKISNDTSGGLLRILRIVVAGKKPIHHPLDYVLAFYDFDSDKIVIMISNHINEVFSATASDDNIALSLTHEMMHMFSHQNPNRFLSLFKEELNGYYSVYFKEIFKLKDDKLLENHIEQLYRFLFLKGEMATSSVSLTELLHSLEKLEKFSTLNKDEFKNVCMDYMKLTKLLYQGDNIKLISLSRTTFKYLVTPLYNSYKINFNRYPIKGCLQELIFPSEVICGLTDIKISSKIKDALKSIG